MLPELGYFCLVLLVILSAVQVLFSAWGEVMHQPKWLSLNPFFSVCQMVLAFIAFGTLSYAFITDDFTVRYVAAHSNSQLPIFFKFAATWGGHEGSMLFWLTMLSLWTGVFCFFSRRTDRLFANRTLAVLALIAFGFSLFIVSVSNPFERGFPPPPEGRDLNPMLQDIGLIFHPPLLYLGYVGFAVSFAMMVAMLLGGVFDYAIARWIRPWTAIAWGILTAGIVLGAWWAYYELGWGGWWFWDPVENASLMPWLLGTALVHSLIVSEQRGAFNYWTILLAIFAFALSLLGTFIVRSGVLTSVHAFAVDADRGIALLILFFSLSFVALSLFALRANLWSGDVRFRLFSKETAFLLINGLFVVACCVVVLGTFYPMIFTAMKWGSISVGAPYFNIVFTPLALILLSIMGFAVVLRWKSIPMNLIVWQLLLLPIAVLLSCGLIFATLSHDSVYQIEWLPLVFISLAIWIILTHLPYRLFMWQIKPLAMRLAHIGFAIAVIGAMMNSYYGNEMGVRMKIGDRSELAGIWFEYSGFQHQIGQNYTSEQAIFNLYDGEKFLGTVYPEQRYYDVRTMTMSEVGLAHKGLDDIYIVMGDKLGNKEYAFRLHYKPYIQALWLGGVMMVIASFLALLGYKRK
ncbi:cytochrome C biogenesis protein CcmF [Vespertiliibacter pulmonis]|uniref:Cytochrome c-type biogenesis protein NrfE n=1 Tax=Vespertiliibacter pulmonis TaxID=1443036 RepID=A0A3N4W698_9PAST|nr:heme lyase CcmF/NrfE family subunit [Vespertiliibacter pulmonis]QLB20960.1 cytochrome C biogenesis protein CcmF [Vespertiliibacter pulmonis]RPE80734.1 cytochrome c-type biogenesis protein NrfE [Vespertiliibacter pulmonis]